MDPALSTRNCSRTGDDVTREGIEAPANVVIIQASACVHHGPDTRSISSDDASWAFEARTSPLDGIRQLFVSGRGVYHTSGFAAVHRETSADLAAQKMTGSEYALRSAFASLCASSSSLMERDRSAAKQRSGRP